MKLAKIDFQSPVPLLGVFSNFQHGKPPVSLAFLPFCMGSFEVILTKEILIQLSAEPLSV